MTVCVSVCVCVCVCLCVVYSRAKCLGEPPVVWGNGASHCGGETLG